MCRIKVGYEECSGTRKYMKRLVGPAGCGVFVGCTEYGVKLVEVVLTPSF